MAPCPTYDDLRRRLGRLVPTPWTGSAYRSCAPTWARSADLVSGLGSFETGGRWNLPGTRAVYAALTPHAALEEALAPFGIARALPRVLAELQLDVGRSIDLTVGATRRRLRVSRKRMTETRWRDPATPSVTQLIGRAAAELRVEALIVPSAVLANQANIVVFPENLAAASKLVAQGLV